MVTTMVSWVGRTERAIAAGDSDEVMSMSAMGLVIERPRANGVRAWVAQMIVAIRAYRPVEAISRRPISPRLPVHGVTRAPGPAAWPDGSRVLWPVGEPTGRR